MALGKKLSCEIIDLANDGRGIGRVNGKAYFIEGALPGEEVQFSAVKEKRNFGEGRISKALIQSDYRRDPKCKYFSRCGGCSLQHLDHNNQITIKNRQLLSSLAHAGFSPSRTLDPLTGLGWKYRRRARLAVQRNKIGQFIIGFRQSGSKRIEAVEKCLVLDDSLDQILSQLPIILQDVPHSIKIIGIELVAAENASAVAITASKPLTTDVANRIIKNLYMIDASIQLWWRVLSESGFSCLSDASASLFYSIDNRLKIYFEPGQFIQVNREVNDLMIKKMVQLLSLESKGTIVDLFCGSGNLSLPLAQYFDHVIGVEGVRSLVNKAIENARDNVVSNCKFVVADLSHADSLNGITEMVDQIDAVVLDPPRDGAMAIMPWVANSGATMVLYISCHPSTMIRDAKILKSAGYRMSDVGILDMFPHTAHVESISLFVR